MSTDACFVYLYDEASGMLELRATHGALLAIRITAARAGTVVECSGRTV